MKKIVFNNFAIISVISILATACYYDNAEELYHQIPENCDVSAVSYSLDVRNILDQNCISCHGTVDPEAGLNLTNYNDVKANASGIKDRINRPKTDDLLMPQGDPMSKCNIDKVTAWIDAGALNN